MNPFRELSVQLRQWRLDDSVAHIPVATYRTANGKLHHLKANCGLLKHSANVARAELDLARPDVEVCKACSKDAVTQKLTPTRERAAALGTLIQMMEQLEGATPFKRQSVLDAIRRNLEHWIERFSCHQLWQSEALAAIARCETEIAAIAAEEHDVEPLLRVVAAGLHDGIRSAESLRLPALGDAHSYRSSRRRVIADAWGRYQYELSSTANFESAASASRNAFIETAGERPDTLSQLPEQTVLAREAFPDMQEWLAAEWRIFRDAAAGLLVDHWRTSLEALMAHHAARPDMIVDVRVETLSDTARVFVIPFHPVPVAAASGTSLVRVPSIVAEWLQTKSFRARYASVEATSEDTAEVLTLAASMWEPHSISSLSLADVLAAARVLA